MSTNANDLQIAMGMAMRTAQLNHLTRLRDRLTQLESQGATSSIDYLYYKSVYEVALTSCLALIREPHAAGLTDASAPANGKKQLPGELAAYLEEGLKVADLSNDIMKPMLAAAGVTDLTGYDLSRWEGK